MIDDLADDLDVVRLDVPADLSYLSLLGTCVGEVLASISDLPDGQTLTYHVQLALHETATNIIRHAYAGAATGRIQVSLWLDLRSKPRRLVAELRDTGQEFVPTEIAPPEPANLAEGGYGLFLIHSLMDEVVYTPQESYNSWRLVKYLETEKVRG
jgi:serine/threonine-protein kinase RsbW